MGDWMIQEWIDSIFWGWFLIFLPASGFVLMIPVLSVRQVPVAVRVSLAAIFAYLIIITGENAYKIPGNWFDVILLMAHETCIGLLIGFYVRLIFYGFEMAGQIITMETGLAMSSLFNPFEGAATPLFSSLMFYFSVLIFLATDLHHEVIAGFFKSYLLIPIGGGVLNDGLAELVIARSVKLFWITLEMAAPVICVSFMVTLMFAVFGRAVPQMNVFVLSFPIRVLSTIVIFGLSATLFASYIRQYFDQLPGDIATLLRLFGGV